MDQAMSNKRIIVIGSVLLFAGIVGWLIYIAMPRTQILLQIAPSTATLTLDGIEKGKVSYNQKITVTPGTHTLKLSRDEFSTEQITVNVQKDTTENVLLALTPQTEAAWDILRSDPTSVAIFEGYGAKKSTDVAASIEQTNPLYKKLPINTREYYIYLCPSLKDYTNPLKRSICVDLVNDQVRDNALTALSSAGFDLTKEEVYVSTDPKARPIVITSEYHISYYKDLDAHNKPTFGILVFVPISTPNRDARLIDLKDKALADFRAAGFSESKVNIVYVNPELHEFNTSEDVGYPSVIH